MKDLSTVVDLTEILLPYTFLEYSYSRKVVIDYDLYYISDKILVRYSYIKSVYISLSKELESYEEDINDDLYSTSLTKETPFDSVSVKLNVSDPQSYIDSYNDNRLIYKHTVNNSGNIILEKEDSSYKMELSNEYLLSSSATNLLLNYMFNNVATNT